MTTNAPETEELAGTNDETGMAESDVAEADVVDDDIVEAADAALAGHGRPILRVSSVSQG